MALASVMTATGAPLFLSRVVLTCETGPRKNDVRFGMLLRFRMTVFRPQPDVCQTKISWGRAADRQLSRDGGYRRRVRGGVGALLPGIEVGRLVIVGAVAIAASSVPDYAIAEENPAREHGDDQRR